MKKIIVNQYAWIIFVSLFMFFCANHTIIKQGMCSSSPCSTVNWSHRVDIPGYDDTFIETYSLPYLAPTYLFLTNFFNEDNYDFGGTSDHRNAARLVFDYKPDPNYNIIPESYDPNSKKIIKDTSNFTGIFFLIKFIIFLSFPLWIITAYLLRKLYFYNKVIGVISISLLFLIIFIPKIYIMIDIFMFDRDGHSVTFSHLLSNIF